MKKKDKRYKLWKKKNDYKKFREKIKNNKSKGKKNISKGQIFLPYTTFIAPENFSILNNPEETIGFFNNIIKIVRDIPKTNNKSKKTRMQIDLSFVTKITSDALMYLLTIVSNDKLLFKRNIIWRGNFPKDKSINEFIKGSGFLNYMETDKNNRIHKDENIEIKHGNKMDGEIAKRNMRIYK